VSSHEIVYAEVSWPGPRDTVSGKQEDPDDVDEVPIEAADLDWGVPLGCEALLMGHPGDDGHDEEPDDHVRRVEPVIRK
jgi:hypothetical protein